MEGGNNFGLEKDFFSFSLKLYEWMDGWMDGDLCIMNLVAIFYAKQKTKK